MKSEIEQSLILLLSKNLPKLLVERNNHIEHKNMEWLDQFNSRLDNDTRNRLSQYVGGNGLSSFILDELNHRLRFFNETDSNKTNIELRNYHQFSDSVALAEGPVTRLKQIPTIYRITLGLPKKLSIPLFEHVNIVHFGSKIILSRPQSLPEIFPLETGNINIDKNLFNDWRDSNSVEEGLSSDRLYFSIISEGYGGYTGCDILARALEDDLRALYGAMYAMDMFRFDYKISDHAKKPQIIIHREEPTRTIVSTRSMEDDLWSNRFNLGTTKWVEGKKSSGKTEEILKTLSIIGKIYSDDPMMRRIYTACIWYYRARNSHRQLDSLLEATIAIEVVLGDKDEMEGLGLTKLLKNRCAYMLGKDQNERDQIAKTFSDLYKMRSSIVHAGRHRLAPGEGKVVGEALALCGRIIAHELNATKRF